jgi:hypothetical protein
VESLFPDATEANWTEAERIVGETPDDRLLERVALALSAAWRDGCATGMRELAEEAAEIIKTSDLADQEILDQLAKYVRGELWSDEQGGIAASWQQPRGAIVAGRLKPCP